MRIERERATPGETRTTATCLRHLQYRGLFLATPNSSYGLGRLSTPFCRDIAPRPDSEATRLQGPRRIKTLFFLQSSLLLPPCAVEFVWVLWGAPARFRASNRAPLLLRRSQAVGVVESASELSVEDQLKKEILDSQKLDWTVRTPSLFLPPPPPPPPPFSPQ